MDFHLNEDQLSLQKAATEFLAKECTVAAVFEAFEGPDGDSAELYKKLVEQGWLAVKVPEDKGGLGLGAVEQAVLLEQMGYFNVPGPYFSNACLAIPSLLAFGADDEAAKVIDGSRRIAVSIDPEFVLDGHLADAFVVIGTEEVALVEKSDVEVVPMTTIDGTRRVARISVAAGAGERLGDSAELEGVFDTATALLTAESLGGMQWVLDTTNEYVKQRKQFGRAVGSFQAVKHRLADVLIKVESSRSAAYYSAWANEEGAPDAALSASTAKAYVSDAYQWVARQGVQLHGGIGFTWEHPAHLYLKRAAMNAVLLGDSTFHRERALMLAIGER
jgi:alkylation response protein AidB-like acyl-CoA dehydrogenase